MDAQADSYEHARKCALPTASRLPRTHRAAPRRTDLALEILTVQREFVEKTYGAESAPVRLTHSLFPQLSHPILTV